MHKGIFDTHTHLNDPWYQKEGVTSTQNIENAKRVGVSYFCNVGFDIKSSKRALSQALKHQEVFAAVGIHPNEAHKINMIDVEEIDLLANGEKVVAIGEIGLDYYQTGKEHREKQIKLLELQIEIAKKHKLPVALHIRDKDGHQDAYEDALEIIAKHKLKSGIIHCFTQDTELANRFIAHGFYISIPGIVTFKNATILQQTVRDLSLNSLLVETDAPYLAPDPKRGQMNSSEYIAYTVDFIANLKNMESADVVSATATNAKKVFGINK